MKPEPAAATPPTGLPTGLPTALPVLALAAPPPAFPFAALQGQPELRLALLLAAIDPAIGGVLVEGPRGTAKSTAARALAALMAPAPFVTLPLGASLEAVVGTLDLQAALSGHAVRLAPGLLARAHGGVLYVDELNLLPDALVDVLLDAAASGVNVIERDGISQAHAARFVLVGTMNPEEGELRPQLRDRLGLSVALQNLGDAGLRQAVVRARLAFDADPARFVAAHAPQQARLVEQLARARQQVAQADALPWSEAVHEAVTKACLQAQVEGLRADLVMLRAARALAAWQGDAAVEPRHVDAVAELVLRHRRHAQAPRPADGRSDAREPASPCANASTAQAPSPPAADAQAGDDVAPAGDAEGDWGALPPQPVGIAAVKPLRALPALPALPTATPLQPQVAKKA
ncbi:MAG: ATP-binding protein [Rubrivivax sp.]|nr:ATP-binding protein [Rubrivivax sp.]